MYVHFVTIVVVKIIFSERTCSNYAYIYKLIRRLLPFSNLAVHVKNPGLG